MEGDLWKPPCGTFVGTDLWKRVRGNGFVETDLWKPPYGSLEETNLWKRIFKKGGQEIALVCKD